MIDNILYIGYVLLTSFRHRKKLVDYSRFYAKTINKSSLYFLRQSFLYYLKYKMHPLDYFYYDIPNNTAFNPEEHASTRFMYRFHRKMNDRKVIKYFYNKMLFHEKFRQFMGHEFLSLKETDIDSLRKWILARNPQFLIIKKMKSVGGFGVKRISVSIKENSIFINDKPVEQQFNYLKTFDMLEEFVQQHVLLNKLNPSCLNTIRIVSVIDKSGRVNIPGAVIRMGVNNDVDNFHSGGIAVNINLETGKLQGKGFRLAPSSENIFEMHPVTKIKFDGYQLPYWNMLIETVKKASLVIPSARTIGWDVAITKNGVSLIEGNHDWDKIIIEKALNRGIRRELESYI